MIQFRNCAGLLLAFPVVQEVELTRPLPGLEVHTTYALDGAGVRTRNGPYRVQYSQGPVIVEGAFVSDRREGEWLFRTPEGSAFARGSYVAGEREGEWSLYSGTDSEVFAKGWFAAGEPSRTWTFRAVPGGDGAASKGKIRALRGTLPAGVTFDGFLFDDLAHGPWVLRWNDGSLLLQGFYDRGVAIGLHEFRLPGGVDALGMASARCSGTPLDPGRPLHPALFADLDDLGRVREPTPPPPRALAEVIKGLPPIPITDRERTEEQVAAYVESLRASLRSGKIHPAGSGWGGAEARLAALWSLEPLMQVDWGSNVDAQRARSIINWLLPPTMPGIQHEWDWTGAAQSAESNRAALLRLYGYIWLDQFVQQYSDFDFLLRKLDPAHRSPYARRAECLLPIPEWAAGRSGQDWRGPKVSESVGVRNLSASGGSGTEASLRAAIAWLRDHQDQDGRWSGDGFMKHDPEADQAHRPMRDDGERGHDVGITSLALLAWFRSGEWLLDGRPDPRFVRGIDWLVRKQDSSGAFEVSTSKSLYDHALATLCVAEVLKETGSTELWRAAQGGVNYLQQTRNRYGGWRYDVRPKGDNDTSVTAWAVCALGVAARAGLAVDPEVFNGAKQWFQDVYDPSTGRCGYDSPGSLSAREPGRNEQYPAQKGEAMTAAALLCRFFLGEDPDKSPIMKAHAELLLKSLPRWEPDAKANDMYYWHYGSYAMHQMGGRYWEQWNKAMKDAALKSQRHQPGSTAYHGSWDPIGPWGFAGGRVYSTSIMALALCVYWQERSLAAR